MSRSVLRIACILLLALAVRASSQTAFVHDTVLMGSYCAITVVAEDAVTARRAHEAAVEEIVRIEAMLSSWRPTSVTSQVNGAGVAEDIDVPEEWSDLVQRCAAIHRLTRGAFDPTVQPLVDLWVFDGDTIEPPAGAAIDAALERVGLDGLLLDTVRGTARWTQANGRIGFGAIGKGYTADRVADLLQGRGVESGVINMGGDLRAWGLAPAEDASPRGPWTVGIADPEATGTLRSTLTIGDRAVVTSGDAERYVVIDGVRHGHIIDPRTGWPARGLRSVTVVCASAELADALATAAVVEGPDRGRRMLEELPGVEGLLLLEDGSVRTTSGIRVR